MTLNDFAGGLNTVTAPRDLAGKQLPTCTNFDPSSPGQLVVTSVGDIVHSNTASKPTTSIPNPGTDAFVFNADYQMDQISGASSNGTNATENASEFICTRDATDNANDALEIEGANKAWREDIFGADTGSPVDYYSAEGDLFGSGISSAPRSVQFVDRTHVDSVSIKKWKQLSQNKTAPTHETATNLGMDLYDETLKDRGDDFVHWGIKFNSTADTGMWTSNSATTGGDYYEFGASFLYKNGAESDIVVIGNSSEDNNGGGSTGADTNNFSDHANKSVKVAVWITPSSAPAAYRDQIYGSKLYSRDNSTNTWYLLAEMDFNKGIKGDGEDGFAAFTAGSFPDSDFTLENTDGFTAATGYIGSPPVLITYELANGFCPGDLATNRQVNWKCSVVANSRAYIGNVTLKDIGTFGDRLLKSPVFQYDTFTEDLYIDVAPNDGDQIMALEAYADRILVFKEKVLYIVNASKELEFLESEHRYAGVKLQGAITKTPFGVVWANKNGAYFYDGDKVNMLQLGKIIDTDWNTNITDNATVGYDELTQQVIFLWDTSTSGTGKGYIYSFSSGCWHELAGVVTQSVNISNFINLNDYNLVYIGGTAAGILYNWGVPTSAVSSGNATTADIHFGNFESNKNICAVTISYKNGPSGTAMDVEARGNLGTFVTLAGSVTGSGDTQLDTVSGSFTVQKFDTTGVSNFQGIKTFQIKISGSVDETLEIEDISITYRDLGVH